MKARDMLDMKVSQLTVDPFTNMPIIILKSERGDEALPIWIGLIEASAIATELEKISLDRPMTHDLMKNIIGQSGLKVERVEVHDVRDNTFYASIHLVGARGRAIAIDSRPSDAIALALRTGARIRVARKVLERTQRMDLSQAPGDGAKLPAPNGKDGGKKPSRRRGIITAGRGPLDADDAARLRELLESLSDDEFGKWKM